MKNDKYKSARGGWSRILDISCENCQKHVCFYQKDGPGPLKRLYVDRFIDTSPTGQLFCCPNCNHELGVRIIYKKESRPAYRLFQSSVNKKIARQSVLR